MKRIALYHLETLLWISRLGSFAAAADRLNTTQPAISARVREIETQLGIKIFQREGRRMILTARGRQLVRDCEPHWTALERTLVEIGSDAVDRGIVRIGTGEIAAASCLPAFLAALKSDLPGVSLEVAVDLTAQMLEQLLAGARDIVFLAGPVVSPGIRTHAIGSIGTVWAGNRATADRIAADPDHVPPIWSLPRHSPLHGVMQASLATSRFAQGAVNTCNNVRTLIDVVIAGGGIALLPATMADTPLRTGLLIEVLPRPEEAIIFEAAIRTGETDSLVARIFERTRDLAIVDPLA